VRIIEYTEATEEHDRSAATNSWQPMNVRVGLFDIDMLFHHSNMPNHRRMRFGGCRRGFHIGTQSGVGSILQWFAFWSTVLVLGPTIVLAQRVAEVIAPGPSTTGPARWMGSPSCSALACHGNLSANRRSDAIWGNEHTIWIEGDRHSRAYEVLFDRRSIQIAQRLGLANAHQAHQCLVCHSPSEVPHQTDVVNPGRPFAPPLLGEGVGCESCHGRAEHWLEPHWRRKLSSDEKSALGMVETEDLYQRAKQCAGCHVGGPGDEVSPRRDVNHELIAAGHPAMRYEFATYLAKMPKHWSERRRDPTNRTRIAPGFEAQAWAVGQAATAAAALELLADRASGDRKPWPEFAEYDCFACHHELAAQSWRQRQYASQSGKLRIGAPRWGTWHYPLVRLLSPTAPASADDGPHELALLEDLMSTPAADRRAIGEHARAAARAFQNLGFTLASQSWDRARLDRLIERLTVDSTESPLVNWDSAAQTYLAFVAIRLANRDLSGRPSVDDVELGPLIRQLYNELLFSRSGDEEPFRRQSTHGFEPGKTAELLKQLQQSLRRDGVAP
jgi:hypothetical protein